ncbi:MAG: hypothetical protein ACYSYL_19495 [Planctomycetota bacterium]|jgi:hypothetical protein
MKKPIFFLISLFITIPCIAEGRTIYVYHNAPGPIHDGANWAHAYNYAMAS